MTKPFPDEDFNRLKAFCETGTPEVQDLDDLILAALARLGASEVIAEDHASIYPNDPAVLRWRKAAGK